MEHLVSALLLAAGSGRRMGRTKQLLPLGNRPVIEHVAVSVFEAGVSEVVVVTGRGHEAVRSSLAHLPVRFASNEDPESDMAGSVRAGLDRIDAAASGVLICLADHPLVSPETMAGLIRMHARSPDRIIIPVHNGRKGHPSLFPFELIQRIAAASSLRDIISANPDRVLLFEVPDEGVLLDMDTEEDYRMIAGRYKKQEACLAEDKHPHPDDS